MRKRKLFEKFDIIIAVLVVFAALTFVFAGYGRGSGAIAEIRVNSEIYKTVDLSEVTQPYDLEIRGELKAVLHIERGAIYFEDSECKDKICVHTGRLSKAGDSAVCLPAKISVTVVGNESKIDGVAR